MFEKSIVAVRPFKLALLASVALAAAGATAPAFAATSASASASATVIVPIAITKAADLSFGKFASGATGGSITVQTDGSRAGTGDVLLTNGGTNTAASFTITGEPGATYTIDTTGTSANLSSSGNNLPLSLISDFAATASSAGTKATGTLTGGTQTLFVGGTLTVGANQPAGNYTGSVAVAVAYN
jgi:spore coat protein U-like protein